MTQGQYYTGIVAGTNISYEPGDRDLYGDLEEIELHWSINGAINFNDHWTLGINSYLIYQHKYFPKKQNTYFLIGLFGQWAPKILVTDMFRFHIELGAYRGNYCKCDNGYAAPKDDLYYWSYGMGIDVPLSKRFHFDLGWLANHIINKIPEGKEWDWNYILGINYYLAR